jgi:RNA polymerase sigma-70 factor, ECF subfamily
VAAYLFPALDRLIIRVEMTDPRELSDEISDARRRFDDACERLRPDLHRFCTRMVGNPWDGEDVVHEALVAAFYRFAELRDPGALRSWLFRIAHNKCIDALRARRRFEPLDVLDANADDATTDRRALGDDLDDHARAARTLSNIVIGLPPRERACVVLKDVLECSLEETAEITGSSVGAVKAALHRGRTKLEDAPAAPPTAIEPAQRALVERYVTAFNRRDWAGVRALLSTDARLELVDRDVVPFAKSSYFTNHDQLRLPWTLELAVVDGIEAIVQFRERDGRWIAHSVVRLELAAGAVTTVRDYLHVDYLLRDSEVTRRPT